MLKLADTELSIISRLFSKPKKKFYLNAIKYMPLFDIGSMDIKQRHFAAGTFAVTGFEFLSPSSFDFFVDKYMSI
jgi:hypothetical protein